jgi:hypothetical protein
MKKGLLLLVSTAILFAVVAVLRANIREVKARAATGYDYGIDYSVISCPGAPNNIIETSSCYYPGFDPGYFCGEGYGVCSSNNKSYTLANSYDDPDECGDDGGGGGGGSGGGDGSGCEEECGLLKQRRSEGHYFSGRQGFVQEPLVVGLLLPHQAILSAFQSFPVTAMPQGVGRAGAAPIPMTPVLAAQEKPRGGPTSAAAAIGPRTMARIAVKVDDTVLDGRTRCDANGNLYVFLAGPGAMLGTGQLPIQEITPTGNLAATFRASEALAAKNFRNFDTFVSSGGDVYQLAAVGRDVYLLKFAGDGSFRSKLRLEVEAPAFRPYQLAVFPSGEILLSGLGDPNLRTPVTAVFDAGGRLLKRVYEPEDEEARKQAEGGNPDLFLDSSKRASVFGMMGDNAVGSDGNVYLLRAAAPAPVYVVSPAGAVVRKFRVDPGDPSLRATSIRFNSGRLAIGFERVSNGELALIKVVDVDGQPLSTFEADHNGDELWSLGCYGAQGFTIIPRDPLENKMYLLEPAGK